MESMKALVYRRETGIHLEERPLPLLVDDRDAIVEVTLSTICTSDLHILRGAVPRARDNIVLGHEFVGRVMRTGSGVKNLRPSDRVAANCITFCGECWFCRRGYINNCVHGGWELGCRIDGCQAAYVRVPYADRGLFKIPDSVSDREALFTGDILSSGYFGAELCGIQPGDTVAVIGAGPVGLCAMECARLFGAAKVVAIELDDFRRELALREGLCDAALAPDMDTEAAIKALSGGRGADGVIEAAGTSSSFELAWRVARPNAVVAVVAMYEKNQTLPLPVMYGKNLIFKTGGVDAVHCDRLLELLAARRLRTDFLITQEVPLNDIPDAYARFEEQEDCLKIAVTPYRG